MAWTDKERGIACQLRASFWSLGAIACALDKKRRAVKREFTRMRNAEDERIQRADFIRSLAQLDGVDLINAPKALALIQGNPGFMAGLTASPEVMAA